MRPTRRSRAAVAVAVLFAVLAIVFDHPVLLFGTVGVGVWLLIAQYDAARAFVRIDDDLVVSVTPAREQLIVTESTDVTVSAELQTPSTATVTVTAEPPVGTTVVDGSTTLTLASGERSASTTFVFEPSVAGEFAVPPVAVELTDAHRSFAQVTSKPVDASLLVEPRRMRDVHVGRGGDRASSAFGTHPAQRGASGLVPAGLREFAPGDTIARIDWKTTARLRYPHVREFERDDSQQTMLVVDHRTTMAVGRQGETMLDYAREVALGLVSTAEAADDPIGCYTVGDGGVTFRRQPTTKASGFAALRSELRTLNPTEPTEPTTSSSPDDGPVIRPITARTAATRLRSDQSDFATRLAPFFQTSDAYVRRIESDPLFEAVRRVRNHVRGTRSTVILTDDTERKRLRETVQAARRDDDAVLVFITPRILFEPTDVGTVERDYERYVAFEEFRRQLDHLPRVSAFEVGPGDRLDEILSQERTTESR